MKYKPEYSAVSTQLMNLRLDNSEIRAGLTIVGDDYCDSRQIDRIDYLKIDVEGAEYDILLNADPNTFEKINNIFLVSTLIIF